MGGNVCEWTSTLYRLAIGGMGDGRETTVTTLDAAGLQEPRVVRGGSWVKSSVDAHAAYRYTVRPDARAYDLGLRLVRVSDP